MWNFEVCDQAVFLIYIADFDFIAQTHLSEASLDMGMSIVSFGFPAIKHLSQMCTIFLFNPQCFSASIDRRKLFQAKHVTFLQHFLSLFQHFRFSSVHSINLTLSPHQSAAIIPLKLSLFYFHCLSTLLQLVTPYSIDFFSVICSAICKFI